MGVAASKGMIRGRRPIIDEYSYHQVRERQWTAKVDEAAKLDEGVESDKQGR